MCLTNIISVSALFSCDTSSVTGRKGDGLRGEEETMCGRLKRATCAKIGKYVLNKTEKIFFYI